MRVLLTGISGFLGVHAMDHILVNTDWDIVGVASWTHKGIPERLLQSSIFKENRSRVTIITHDLTAPFSELTKRRIGKVDYVLNYASESHVDRSITDPVPFIQNNVSLVINMLEFAREAKPRVFLQVSTDEVMGATDGVKTHKEWESVLPSNPYSGSKAAQEAIAISYWRTYGVPVIITNNMNCIGEYQDKEKFVPKIIKSLMDGSLASIHAVDGKAGTRFYLHARNIADANLFILDKLSPRMYPQFERPCRFNIVGEQQITNLDMAYLVAKAFGKPLRYKLLDAHTQRPGHDPHYGLDGAKIRDAGWVAPFGLERSLLKTVEWYKKNPEWLQ